MRLSLRYLNRADIKINYDLSICNHLHYSIFGAYAILRIFEGGQNDFKGGGRGGGGGGGEAPLAHQMNPCIHLYCSVENNSD